MLTSIGKYEIVAELGQGAMGIVYKARDPLIGRMVALKTITSGLSGKPELLERFYQEARSAGALQHPNIVTIFELGKEGDTPYIAMEFLEGDSLEKIVHRRDPMPLSKKIGYMAQICSALDYAHKHGVIHRDIKPGNIMLTKDGTVKVVDFGIARLIDTSKTQTGLMIGTPAYMSPQLLRGERADERADIWALGVMVYEMIAYQRPFLGDNPAALMWNIISQQPKPLREIAPGCPAELEEVVGRMLEKEAPLRLQSMEDVLLELDPLYKRLQRGRFDELVVQSRELIQNQELTKAQGLLREALHLDSSNSEAKTLLDRVGAEIRRMQTETRAKDQLVKAQALFDAGRLDEAKTEADVAVRIDPKYEPAQELAARVKEALDRIRTLQEKLQGAKQRIAEGSLGEADQLLDDALAIDAANEQAQLLRKHIREETNRRERRKRISDGVQQARGFWSQLRHEECIQILAALQKEFPNESDINELLATVRHDQAEQQKQEGLGEARNLLAAQRYDDALVALGKLRKAYPTEPAVVHLTTLVQQEQQAKAKRQHFEAELAALRAKVTDAQWEEALKRGEQLSKEFPQEFELLELVKFVRGEMQRAEQKRALDEKLKQVHAFFDAGSFAQAAKAAEKALAESPGNVDLMILLERSQTQQKEKEKRDFLEKRIREVKARINRDELTDAIDLARQTVMSAGPDTDITQLLHAAEMEMTQREKKKEQDKQVDAAKTLIVSGNFAEATRVLDQAMATQVLDAADPRVQQVLHDIRETEEKKKREEAEKKAAAAAEKKAAAERQAATEQSAAQKKAAEKKSAAEKKTAEKKPQAAPPAKGDKGGSAPPPPSAPSTSWPPASSGTPGRDYVYQPATMIPGGPSGPSETQPMEAASATMIASGMPMPTIEQVAQPVARAASVAESTIVEVAPKPEKKKPRAAAPVVSEVRVELPEEPRPEKPAAPVWKQPIPLAIGGLVLAAVLGITIYKVSQPAGTGLTNNNAHLVPDKGDGSSGGGTIPEVNPNPQPPPNPVDQGQEKLKAQQQKLTDQAKTEGAAGKYDDALRLLEQAVSLNGSNPEIQGLKDQYTKAKTADVHTQAILAQEGQFWDQGVAAFNRDRLDEAAGNFQKILPLQSQGGIKASDANDYLNTRIPNRKKADQLFSDAQQLAGQTNDLASLQKAQGDLNQIASLDAGRQDATNLLGTVTTRINELNAAASTAKTQQDQFNQLKAQFADPATSKDSQKLQSLQGQFRTIENSSSPQASEARNYAENLIPTAMNALKPPAVSTGGTPPPPPAAALLKVQIVSSPHQNAPGLINSKVPQPSSYLDEAPAFAAPPTVPASLKGASGSVVVRLTVDENGNVIGGGYLSGDTSLGTAVVNAAKGAWHFNAPKIKGKPYQAVVVVNVQF